MLDVEKLIAGVHDYIGRALAPFALRVKVLEDRAPERGEKGEPGAIGERGADGLPGKSAYQLAVERGFSGTELQWLDSLAGKPGRDGINGKDAAPVDVAAIAREAAALVPVPKDGKPGPAGKDIDPALLNDAIDRKLADAVSKLPAAKNGHDADPADVIRAAREAVEAMPRPADGRSVTVEDVEPLIESAVGRRVGEILRAAEGRPPKRDIENIEFSRRVSAAINMEVEIEG